MPEQNEYISDQISELKSLISLASIKALRLYKEFGTIPKAGEGRILSAGLKEDLTSCWANLEELANVYGIQKPYPFPEEEPTTTGE